MPFDVVALDVRRQFTRHRRPSRCYPSTLAVSAGRASKARSNARRSHTFRLSMHFGDGILPSSTISSNFVTPTPTYAAAAGRPGREAAGWAARRRGGSSGVTRHGISLPAGFQGRQLVEPIAEQSANVAERRRLDARPSFDRVASLFGEPGQAAVSVTVISLVDSYRETGFCSTSQDLLDTDSPYGARPFTLTTQLMGSVPIS